MVYPAPFLRLVASGTLFGIEQFSWSLSLVPDFADGPPEPGPDAVPQGVVDAVAALHTSARISQAARLTALKLNMIGENGRYLSQSETVWHDYGAPGLAGGGGNYFPPQVALAVSLLTDSSRGRAHAGRFYLPTPAAGIEGDGRWGAGPATEVAASVTTMLDAINGAVSGYTVGVASDIGTGTFRRCTGIRVGRTLDTIRSRRTSLPEAYVIGASLSTGGGGGAGGG